MIINYNSVLFPDLDDGANNIYKIQSEYNTYIETSSRRYINKFDNKDILNIANNNKNENDVNIENIGINNANDNNKKN